MDQRPSLAITAGERLSLPVGPLGAIGPSPITAGPCPTSSVNGHFTGSSSVRVPLFSSRSTVSLNMQQAVSRKRSSWADAKPGAIGTLSKAQRKALLRTEVGERNSPDEDMHHHSEHGHHGSKPESIFTAVAAAIINFLLMFGLCCAYGLIMFEDDWNAQHRGMAVKMNLGTALIGGLMLASFSKVPVAIGGPDLNPVVFLGIFTGTLAEQLAIEHSLVYPSTQATMSRRLQECFSNLDYDPFELMRRLGSSGSTSDIEFCTGTHLAINADNCANYHAELRATTVFTVAVSSLLLGVLFACLGRFKLTRFVQYVPTNIMEAFLSCVGYKVFKYGLKFCNYEPRQFLPAACVGVPLYFMKALHLGNPAIVIPVMLMVPLCIFYTALYGSGGDVESARKSGFMFGELENADFWSMWQYGLNIGKNATGGFGGNINFKAWSKTLPDLPIMIVVVLLDCLLKLSSTENKLPVKADKDYEIQVYGLTSSMVAACGCSVGYMQLKFNVINFGVMGNVTDRRAGLIYAVLCGIGFFWKTDLFNYLPRFFLATLLFFAGSGFVAENLWGSRKFLSMQEWLQIFVILAVFIISESLLQAVIVGGLMTGVSFILRYAKIPCISGHPLRGDEVMTTERQSWILQCGVRRLSRPGLVLVRLKGFIFFASAQKLTSWASKKMQEQEDQDVPEYKRIQWYVFDCEALDGLDSSASKAIGKLSGLAKKLGVSLIWVGMSDSFRKQLYTCNTITSEKDYFETLEEAVRHIDKLITERVRLIHDRWTTLHPTFGLASKLSNETSGYEPFRNILTWDRQRFGCPWQYCGRMTTSACKTLLWKPGQMGVDLFLIHSGKVAVFPSLPEKDDKSGKWPTPSAIYGHGWFLNRQALLNGFTLGYGVALEGGELLFWNKAQWSKMQRERPYMAEAIVMSVLRQQAEDAALWQSEKKTLQTALTMDADEDDDGDFEYRFAPSTAAQEKSNVDLRHSMDRMSIARKMDALGFYDRVQASDEYPVPSLPASLKEEIDIAYNTHCVPVAADSDDVELPATEVMQAMRYIGIHNVVLNPMPKVIVTREEFTTLCSRALFAPFGNEKAGEIRKTLESLNVNQSGDGQPRVDRNDLVSVFDDLFRHIVPLDQVEGIADFWCSEKTMGESALITTVSRFVQDHMYELCLLEGIKRLMGEKPLEAGSKITKQMIMKANSNLTEEEVEEMIWSVDYLNTENDGSEVDFRVLGTVFNAPWTPEGKLPPSPKMEPGASGAVQRPEVPAIRFGSEGSTIPDVKPKKKHVANKKKLTHSPLGSRSADAYVPAAGNTRPRETKMKADTEKLSPRPSSSTQLAPVPSGAKNKKLRKKTKSDAADTPFIRQTSGGDSLEAVATVMGMERMQFPGSLIAEWLEEFSSNLGAIELRPSESTYGMAVFARRDIAAGEVAFALPTNVTLTAETACEATGVARATGLLQSWGVQNMTEFLICLRLCVSLQDSGDTWCRYTSCLKEVHSETGAADAELDHWVKLFERMAEEYEGMSDMQPSCSRSSLEWARRMLRLHSVGDESIMSIRMVPLVGLLHLEGATNALVQTRDELVECRCNSAVKAGDRINIGIEAEDLADARPGAALRPLPQRNLPEDWMQNAILDFKDPKNWTTMDRNCSMNKKSVFLLPGWTRASLDSVVEELDIQPLTWQAKLLLFLDDPESSRAAEMFAVFMGIMIAISVFCLFLEPLMSPPKDKDKTKTQKDVWQATEAFFTVLFTIDLLVLFIFCNALGTMTHKQFIKDPMRISDLVAVLPFYVHVMTKDWLDGGDFLRLFRIVRLMRLCRILRLGRLSNRSSHAAPIAVILVVIWGIYLKDGPS